jgi:4-diphosphocytidyl-2-C-methyl-D-erythritol kinase
MHPPPGPQFTIATPGPECTIASPGPRCSITSPGPECIIATPGPRCSITVFHLGLDKEQLLHYAAQLGSDCPFFILNTPCLGGGRGERLDPLDLDLTGYTFCLVDPGIHISTAQAFSLSTPRENPAPLTTIITQPVDTWRTSLQNDFEPPVFALHPELGQVKNTLYAHGALYASLTGSGSSFFGIFEKDKAPTDTPFPDSYIYRILP